MEENDILNKTASTTYSWKYTLKWKKGPVLTHIPTFYLPDLQDTRMYMKTKRFDE